ncbi:HlyD family efflux transporter periplasmic adaptor subunit [Thalassobius vesicularis]|uniref:HlyD family efflux transporter periplasmic adaptor subunit n=1 Tax=Thalassobius vesicularis TaxID=1294297 RepID=A0A4V3UZB2_9RHOB|nr:HlyD family efflux transporter periplasmic adaptor subunit [Thalassobius vesicularis]THD75969.1 HlyD family efflux transporter periplasmic adaptor subunit [Thalassobius vesicularis]
MRFLRRSLTGLFLLAVTVGLLVYAGAMVRDAIEARLSREARAPQGRERIFAVNVMTAQPGTVTPVLSAFGEVQSRRTLDLRAALRGTIVELADGFEEGGQVRAGDVLVRIDPSDAQAALDRAQADQMDAELESRDAARTLELARDELAATEEQAGLREKAFKRAQDLAARGVATDATVETAELAAAAARQAVVSRRQALAQAEARVDQAATRLNRAGIALAEAERVLADTVIRAEFDGTLSGVKAVAGGLVSQNEVLAQLVDGQALEVAFRISTPQYARLLDGAGQLAKAPVDVTLNLYGENLTAKGRIDRDSAAVGEGQTGRLIFARLEAPRGLKPGDFVSVAVEEPPLDYVVSLPATALDSASRVLLLGAEDRLEALEVRVVRRVGDNVLVRNPDLAGREVVLQRTPLLGAGIKVRPLRNAADAAPQAPQMLELSQERRAKLVAFVEANKMMPSDVRTRILARLQEDKVPAEMVERLEARMGG